MRRADFLRCKESRRNAVTHSSQLRPNLWKAELEVPSHVFEEHGAGLALAHDPRDFRPEVARIRFAQPLPGHAEGLARIASSDDIHDATPRAAVEGS